LLATLAVGDLARLRELADDATGWTVGLLAAFVRDADHDLNEPAGDAFVVVAEIRVADS
jgi:hypothetical protein